MMSEIITEGGKVENSEMPWSQPVFIDGGVYHVPHNVKEATKGVKTLCSPHLLRSCDPENVNGIDENDGISSLRHAEQAHGALPCPDCFSIEWSDVDSLPTVKRATYFIRLYFDGKNQRVSKSIKKREVGYECELCGESGYETTLELHHIIPISAGGTHDQWNTLLLCHGCHGRAESYLDGLFDRHIPSKQFMRLTDIFPTDGGIDR